jgi:hypothetical protein
MSTQPKKKLALLLFGISYQVNKDKYINYKFSLENYKEFIYLYFENLGYTIDVFFSTNDQNAKECELIKDYKPIKHSFIRNRTKPKERVRSRNEKIISVVELCIQSNIKYDNILITRFDLLFKKKFSESNIQFDKINIVSALKNPDLICDNFYFMSYSHLKSFLDMMYKFKKISFYLIKKELEAIGAINYICPENCQVENLSFYKIKRNIVLPFQNGEEFFENTGCKIQKIKNKYIVTKKVKNSVGYCWFGNYFELPTGNYNVSFNIKINKKITFASNCGFKIHIPYGRIYNAFFTNLEPEKVKGCKIENIYIYNGDLCIFIFDACRDLVVVEISDIRYEKR